VRIVAGIDELLEDLGYGVPLPVRARRRSRSESATAAAGATVARLGSAEASAVNALVAGPATADRIADAADLAPATVLAVLTRLEADGLVRGYLGRYQLAGALENLLPARADGQPGEAGP
jgi:predicted Rossmann fold nucleotide-binding protein DprA/Smf involved in DNA uptake